LGNPSERRLSQIENLGNPSERRLSQIENLGNPLVYCQFALKNFIIRSINVT
jgi:hypothetical protein